jgi:SanA protein
MPVMRRLVLRFVKIAVIGTFSVIAVVGALNAWILVDTFNYVYTDIDNVPFNSVGMVLGTSKMTRTGSANQHFTTRMDAAAELYHSGKIQHLILSGDNMTRYYDEPKAMKAELLLRGVPEYNMTLDTAGFRTFDSVVRLKQVFGVNSCTIISEKYHVHRAVFISRHYDLNAVAYAAADVPFFYGIRSRSREILARVKAVLDIYYLDTKPASTN